MTFSASSSSSLSVWEAREKSSDTGNTTAFCAVKVELLFWTSEHLLREETEIAQMWTTSLGKSVGTASARRCFGWVRLAEQREAVAWGLARKCHRAGPLETPAHWWPEAFVSSAHSSWAPPVGPSVLQSWRRGQRAKQKRKLLLLSEGPYSSGF